MAMAIYINGVLESPPGLVCDTWNDNPIFRLKRGEDYNPRAADSRIQQIVLHSTKGVPGGNDHRPQVIRPGFGPSVDAGARVAKFWSRDGRQAGAHLVVDFDGSVTGCADLVRDSAFHAGNSQINQMSIGVEIYQGSDAEFYEGQLAAVVTLVDWLTRRFGIQRQVPHRYLGGPLDRLVGHARSFWGIYGHRDCSHTRGAGDPGSNIMARLMAAGYEAWDLQAMEDCEHWRLRQIALGLKGDGIPGPVTTAALLAAGRPGGMWVMRPGDAPGRASTLVG